MYLWKWYDAGLIGWWNVRNSEGKGGWKYDISEPQQRGGDVSPLNDGSTTGLFGISSCSKVLCGFPTADATSSITTFVSFLASPFDGVANASSFSCFFLLFLCF